MPTTQFPLLAGDGWVEKNATGGSWATNFSTARGATSGTAHYTEQYAYLAYLDRAVFPVDDCNLYRGFHAADTSAIGAGSAITAATLYMFIVAASTTRAGQLCLVSGSQAAGTSLASGDFDNVGTTEFASRVTVAGGLNNAWLGMALNSSGLAAISKTGTTLLATRLDYDLDNSTTGIVTGDQIYAYMRSSEYTTDTTKRPYLEVTYTVPAGGTVKRRPSGLYTFR